MKRKSRWAPGAGVRILGAEQVHGQWVISAVGEGFSVCPDCGRQSLHRHGWNERRLQDLPAQGAAVTVKLRIQRWQCRNQTCKRQTFTGQMPEIAAPLARRTARAAELVHLFGHGVGGRPGERLMKCIGASIARFAAIRQRVDGSDRRSRTVGFNGFPAGCNRAARDRPDSSLLPPLAEDR